MTYDGSREPKGIASTSTADSRPLPVLSDELNQSFEIKEPLADRRRRRATSRFEGAIDDVAHLRRGARRRKRSRSWRRPTRSRQIAVRFRPKSGRRPRRPKLRRCFLETHAPAAVAVADGQDRHSRDDIERFVQLIPTAMVMEEMTPRGRPTS